MNLDSGISLLRYSVLRYDAFFAIAAGQKLSAEPHKMLLILVS